MTGKALAALAGQDRVLVIRKPFVDWLGDIPTALLLDQMMFWQDRAGEGEEWSYTDAQMADHLCLSLYGLSKARDVLVSRKLLTATRKGMPRKMVYCLDLDAVAEGFKAHVTRDQTTSDAKSRHMCGDLESHSIYEGVKKVKDIAPNVTALGTARTAPSKSKAARPAKPLFDAFKAAFPNAHSSMAGKFDTTCTERGFTVDLWHAFMATADARRDYLRGALTMGNALNRFVAWCGDQAPAPLPSDRPAGAPDNWRSLVYSYDGTKLWPALALPRMGLDPHAPPASWPAWYRAFEGVAA